MGLYCTEAEDPDNQPIFKPANVELCTA